MPDARRTLFDTAADWDSCQRCSLHVRRDEFGGPILLGQGEPRGILFIASGPGWAEEKSGVGYSDKPCTEILHPVLKALRIHPVFLTYLVACRSCTPVLNDDGSERLSLDHLGRSRGTMHRDGPPNVPQIKACSSRLADEIYQMDPFIIVALGKLVASTLLGGSVDIRSVRGTPMEVQLPGAGNRASLTKKGAWLRRVKGNLVRPVAQTKVCYEMIPTWSVAEVKDRELEEGPNSALAQFVQDIKLAREVYRRAHEEITGITPQYYEDPVSIFDEGTEGTIDGC